VARGRAHSDRVKAAAIAALLAGGTVCGVAREHNLPKGTVSGWTRQVRSVRPKKEIADLIASYLRELLTALTTLAKSCADREWLTKQDARELAVLFGVMADKALVVLAAIVREESEAMECAPQ